MDDEKLTPKWQGILGLIILWALIISCLGVALYYKWNYSSNYYEPDIEHR